MVCRCLRKFQIISIILIVYLNSIEIVDGSDSFVKPSRDLHRNIGVYNDTKKVGRHVFDYRKNGIRLDINLVSGVNNSINEEDDGFPMPPFKDLGHCMIDLSAICIKNRIARYIDTIGRLDKITLFGNAVKFVKIRESQKTTFSHRSLNSVDKIDRSINDFFDKFALRITLPGWNKRKEQNQIDFMFDDNDLVEGRGKGGGGGKGGKGGGKCKHMMMCMMMGLKMKMVGMMGLMMGSGGGGGHDSGSGGMLKEIVLLTKGSGGGGHSSGGGSSYQPPPPSTYGAPPSSAGSGGYAGGGGGSGWGRSFDNRLPMKTFVVNDNSQEITDNLSIINSYPDLKHSNHLRSIDSHDYIGEVLEPVEIEDHEKYLAIDHGNNKELTDIKTEWENKNDDVNRVYAKYWENYEVANKLWDSKGPIVATKISPIEKLN
ncbi:hypothetical protein PV327_001116 [Microctonus hyperodae]|uniref:Uncharacterized protein n=1 Tax=Microctonus hyperodae TaxID=165561 RepID=A0AA39L2M8_MICHY|nr:hypothetical protein PV327_001116 [Microctonus hyperodae]